MRRFASSLCLVVATGPCATLQPIVDNAPAAQVPVLLSVSSPGSPPVPVQPTMLPEPTYYVLPEAPMIDLTAPWPSSLEVSIDGEVVERTEDQARMQELAGQGKGYYRQLSTEPEGQTFRWKLVVVPPPAKRSGPSLRLGIVDVSANPNLSGAQKRSAPLAVPIGSTLYGTMRKTLTAPSDAFCGNQPSSQGLPCHPLPDAKDGKVTPNAEIRGWIVDDPFFTDPPNDDTNRPVQEYVFSVLLDWGWAPDRSVASLVHPVNTLEQLGAASTASTIVNRGGLSAMLDQQGYVFGGATQIVHVELDGWLNSSDGRKAGLPVPDGWQQHPQHPGTAWSFPPDVPAGFPAGQALKKGDYVRLVGTLWEDSPHTRQQADPPPVAKAKACWSAGFTQYRGWTEMHPADFVARIAAPPAHHDAIQSFAACGDGTFAHLISPPGPRPSPASTVGYEEHVDGDFTVSRSIGAGTQTGSKRITVRDDGILLEVTTQGAGGLFPSYTGKFKASYRVFWR